MGRDFCFVLGLGLGFVWFCKLYLLVCMYGLVDFGMG